jgi:hypothetical protein
LREVLSYSFKRLAAGLAVLRYTIRTLMTSHTATYLAHLTVQVCKVIAHELSDSKVSSVAASAFEFHFSDKDSLKFQNYYVETVQDRNAYLSSNGFFLRFKKMYALQGIDKEYLNNLESEKESILDALEADELTALYLKYFAQASIRHGTTQRMKNLGSFFAKLTHTFRPSDYCALDNPIKRHFGLGNEGFYLSFIAISNAYKLWLQHNVKATADIRQQLQVHPVGQTYSTKMTDLKLLDLIFWLRANKK